MLATVLFAAAVASANAVPTGATLPVQLTSAHIADDRSRSAGALLHPVPSINLTQYLGKWYQMYGNLFEEVSFENHSFCLGSRFCGENGVSDGTSRPRGPAYYCIYVFSGAYGRTTARSIDII